MKYTLLLSSVALMASAMQAIPNPIETIRIKHGDSYLLELKRKKTPTGLEYGYWKLNGLSNDNVKVKKVHVFDPTLWTITGLTQGTTTVDFDFCYTQQCSFDDWQEIREETRTFNFIVE